ncbi:MAG: FprA family A-type flavoprotein [Coriobacteriia bacterium]|nr:FprA family A-type flavoprotein [Coriobacteriia bacterium]MBN2822332.1 FprA family A-type flavoprotein [Coriobacteriia bacterium]
MRAVPVSDGIFWVGAIDWNLRDFHGYETPRGTTYNAYLVRGQNMTALIDTVKAPFVPELLSRIADVMDPAQIDLIVVNHVEPDHNGGLPAVMAACPNARVVASGSGVRGVAEYHDGLVVDPVSATDVIDLGGKTLQFLPMPMVHWPDSMFTYCAESRTLMPNDAFGQHMASSARFASEVGMDLALEELAIYYANILMPLGKQVTKAVEKVVATGWEIDVVAPAHGVIWRGEEFGRVLEAYGRWSQGETTEKAVVAYATMWGSTKALAESIADGIAAEGVQVYECDLTSTAIAQVTHELLEARALVLGSPTLHHGMLYKVSGYLTWLEGLHPAGKMGAVFGSYGWGGGAVKQITGRMEAIGFEMPIEPFSEKFRPTEDDLAAAHAWGRDIGKAIKDGASE